MLSCRFSLFLALFLVSLNGVSSQGFTIPGLTDGQQTCLADCIFVGLSATSSCGDPDAVDPDVACYCGSSAYTTNVTQCASATCSVCTTGGCNITANPLVDVCNSTTLASGLPSPSQTSAASVPSGSGNSPSGSRTTTSGPSQSGSGSAPAPSVSGSTAHSAGSALFDGKEVTGGAALAACLVLIGMIV
ncbi:hypothetical protein B0H11DRAFT_974626 [Mycena galericulata]|nr:hypothetical protein B0H11DRAFT_974626 [Mycena galericulata]